MIAIDRDTVLQHTDVDCPPDPQAECRHCGEALSRHVNTEDPETSPAPGNAVCLDADVLAERRAVRYRAFELADGESLDCPNVGPCSVCDVTICSEHSSEFVTCAESPATLHHNDCRDRCGACVRGLGPDRVGDH